MRLLNKIGAAAVIPSTNLAALLVLEHVAIGTIPETHSDLEGRVGFALDVLRNPVFRQIGVRVCALHALGKTGLPVAVDFLKGYKPTEAIGVESAPLCRRRASLCKKRCCWEFQTRRAEASFWKAFCANPTMRVAASPSRAIEQLCDAGAAPSLPLIRASLKRMWSGQTGDDRIDFCEARIQALGRDPDRARALATVFESVVSLESTSKGRDLLQWATRQLSAIHSVSGDAELERIANQLGTMEKGFPDDLELSKLAPCDR